MTCFAWMFVCISGQLCAAPSLPCTRLIVPSWIKTPLRKFHSRTRESKASVLLAGFTWHKGQRSPPTLGRDAAGRNCAVDRARLTNATTSDILALLLVPRSAVWHDAGMQPDGDGGPDRWSADLPAGPGGAAFHHTRLPVVGGGHRGALPASQWVLSTRTQSARFVLDISVESGRIPMVYNPVTVTEGPLYDPSLDSLFILNSDGAAWDYYQHPKTFCVFSSVF